MQEHNRYRILHISRRKVDPTVFSGSPYFMSLALRRGLGEVHVLDDMYPGKDVGKAIRGGPDLMWRMGVLAARRLGWRLRARRYDCDRNVLLAKYYAKQIQRHLADNAYDFIFIDKEYVATAFLETDTPIIYSHDAVFDELIGYDAGFANLAPPSLAEARFLEKRAVDKSVVCIYHSRWGAESAVRCLGLPQDKVLTIHFGPGLEGDPLEDDPASVPKRLQAPCRLLLVGVDWLRKGCDTVVAAVRELIAGGVDVSLTICGCTPPPGVALPGCVTVVPRLNKTRPAEYARLVDLHRTANLFIFPSQAECLGISVVEAMTFGTPVLTSRVGGLPEVVQHGVNGFVLPPDASGRDYARLIQRVIADEELYRTLSVNARKTYEGAFNWDAWIRRIEIVLRRILRDRSDAGQPGRRAVPRACGR